MEEKVSLAKAVQRLLTDGDLRRRLLVAPREVLMAELGISGETYDALTSLVPVVLAGGLYLLSGAVEPGTLPGEGSTWGGWGK